MGLCWRVWIHGSARICASSAIVVIYLSMTLLLEMGRPLSLNLLIFILFCLGGATHLTYSRLNSNQIVAKEWVFSMIFSKASSASAAVPNEIHIHRTVAATTWNSLHQTHLKPTELITARSKVTGPPRVQSTVRIMGLWLRLSNLISVRLRGGQRRLPSRHIWREQDGKDQSFTVEGRWDAKLSINNKDIFTAG